MSSVEQQINKHLRRKKLVRGEKEPVFLTVSGYQCLANRPMQAGAVSSQNVLRGQKDQLILEADHLPPFVKVKGLSPQLVCFDLILT